MAEIVLSGAASADLEHIYDWSAEQFGSPVADTYIRQILARFDLLRDHPLAGRARNDILQGLRSISHDRHLIFYVIGTDQVVVARVIHGARNVRANDFG